MSLEGGREGRGGEGREGRGGEGRGGEGREGSPPSHFGDIFFEHFCCAILDYVT